MRIGGWHKVSLIDYPGTVATVIFTSGCVFRCGFCHNPELVIPPTQVNISEADIFTYLALRKKTLQGVVVTGGEPTLQHDLPEFLLAVRSLGYKVKLDTCGYLPKILTKIFEERLVDYVAMDIKAPYEKYARITGVKPYLPSIKKSIQLILSSSIPHEFRTTLIDGFHALSDIIAMAKMIQGADAYYLQKFRSAPKLVNPSFSIMRPPPDALLNEAASLCRFYVKACTIRE